MDSLAEQEGGAAQQLQADVWGQEFSLQPHAPSTAPHSRQGSPAATSRPGTPGARPQQLQQAGDPAGSSGGSPDRQPQQQGADPAGSSGGSPDQLQQLAELDEQLPGSHGMAEPAPRPASAPPASAAGPYETWAEASIGTWAGAVPAPAPLPPPGVRIPELVSAGCSPLGSPAWGASSAGAATSAPGLAAAPLLVDRSAGGSWSGAGASADGAGRAARRVHSNSIMFEEPGGGGGGGDTAAVDLAGSSQQLIQDYQQPGGGGSGAAAASPRPPLPSPHQAALTAATAAARRRPAAPRHMAIDKALPLLRTVAGNLHAASRKLEHRGALPPAVAGSPYAAARQRVQARAAQLALDVGARDRLAAAVGKLEAAEEDEGGNQAAAAAAAGVELAAAAVQLRKTHDTLKSQSTGEARSGLFGGGLCLGLWGASWHQLLWGRGGFKAGGALACLGCGRGGVCHCWACITRTTAQHALPCTIM